MDLKQQIEVFDFDDEGVTITVISRDPGDRTFLFMRDKLIYCINVWPYWSIHKFERPKKY